MADETIVVNRYDQNLSQTSLMQSRSRSEIFYTVVRTSAFPGQVNFPYEAPPKILWTLQLHYPLPPPTPYNPNNANAFPPRILSTDPPSDPKPSIFSGEKVGTDGMPFIFQSKDTLEGFYLPPGGIGSRPEVQSETVIQYDYNPTSAPSKIYDYVNKPTNAVNYDVLNYGTGYAPDVRFNSVSIATIEVELDNLDSGNFPVILR